MILDSLVIPVEMSTGLLFEGLDLIKQGLQSVVGFFKESVDEAMSAQDIQAQLNAVLQSTNGIAGVTAEKANQLADALSQVTRFDDEAVLSGENLLLTFTNIGSDIFPQATETMLDMSQALGQDLKSSAIQLGKALQDPILGVTALRRVGVNFNEEQQKMIKQLVESGNAAEAQAMILKELQTEFGGSARAAGETLAGQLDILKTALGNVKESIGGALLPVLTDLVTRFKELVLSPEFQERLDKFTTWIKDEAVPWIEGKLIPIFNTLITKTIPDLIRKFKEWVSQSKTDITGWVSNNTSGIQQVEDKWETFKSNLKRIFDTITGNTTENSNAFGRWGSILDTVMWVAQHGLDLFNWQAGNFLNFAGLVKQAVGELATFFGWLADTINAAASALANWNNGNVAGSQVGNWLNNTGSSLSNPSNTTSVTVHGRATGGAFTVPGGFPSDSYIMGLTSGEHVTVTPNGQKAKEGAVELSDKTIKKLSQLILMGAG